MFFKYISLAAFSFAKLSLGYQINVNGTTADELNTSIFAQIINGTPATKTEYPFISQVYQTTDNGNNFSFICTASLISSQYIVTAAHCVYNNNILKPASQLYFNIGKQNLAVSADISSFYKATNIYVNQYLTLPQQDIAIVKLDRAVPATVATPAKIYPYKLKTSLPIEVAGFGVTDLTKNQVSSKLMKTTITISESSKCSTFGPSWKSNSGQSVCTITTSGNDSCQGDSGGPMVTKINGVNTLVGVTSYGQNMTPGNNSNCGANNIAFYTRAAYFAPWVSSLIGADIKSIIQLQ
ncbi:Chymotrypsinogen B2 [Smittium culicis]|uniref:Chymotrypsinogen B2 n=1 Tax=Smittium culicis TaxID=133412 RepID=A0A1R1XY17_9FUNG|nr:Chymotrypsinogen B2 [Smittium culicis]